LRRQTHEGALVAIYVGQELLLVRSSYRAEWNFPGGSIRTGETPEAAAHRELSEEIGLAASPLLPAGDASGTWDGRRDRVHFFELRLAEPLELRLDNREIIAARLWSPDALRGILEAPHAIPHVPHRIKVTGPVAAYLGKTRPPG